MCVCVCLAGCVVVNTWSDKEVNRLRVALDNFGLARVYSHPLEYGLGQDTVCVCGGGGGPGGKVLGRVNTKKDLGAPQCLPWSAQWLGPLVCSGACYIVLVGLACLPECACRAAGPHLPCLPQRACTGNGVCMAHTHWYDDRMMLIVCGVSDRTGVVYERNLCLYVMLLWWSCRPAISPAADTSNGQQQQQLVWWSSSSSSTRQQQQQQSGAAGVGGHGCCTAAAGGSTGETLRG